MIFYISILIIVICVVSSIRLLFTPYKIKGKRVSLENFLFLGAIYATVMVSFGLLYVLLELHDFAVLDDGYIPVANRFLTRLETGLYFSAITLFSVGYGDIAPIGVGRIIAVIEALIGYTIPAAFVARTVLDLDK
ncbi:potassium channel family protein [Robertmurraya sp. DFI.2.37]|uniref:potassium channel family protein n=1 Tax=Robertmurraya TaxID=2837507 RepID=UPI000BA67B66|nr:MULTISPECIES: potassium channel family protein [Robertmurraya]MDF1508138.1 potassium channel family protein [Robertmurraya sp. DFI.2.37]PAE18749.1 transporter [Bacillus sp. 7504-2]